MLEIFLVLEVTEEIVQQFCQSRNFIDEAKKKSYWIKLGKEKKKLVKYSTCP